MNNLCDFCLNYEPKKKSDSIKSKETCSQSCFKMDENEGMMTCENFTLVICPNISSAVVERFLRKDINFYDNLCDLASIILTMFSYQSIFKIVFSIERGKIEFIDLTNSQNTYGSFDINSPEEARAFGDYLVFFAQGRYPGQLSGCAHLDLRRDLRRALQGPKASTRIPAGCSQL